MANRDNFCDCQEQQPVIESEETVTPIPDDTPSFHKRQIKGYMDEDAKLVFNKYNVANSGENIATELSFTVPSTLRNYTVYFEFTLPNRMKFVSPPVKNNLEELDIYNEKDLKYKKQETFVIRYNLPKFVCFFEGELTMNVKFVNDSNYILKTDVVKFKVGKSVNPEAEDRYFSGDLLDWLTTHKIDLLEFEEGYVIGYATNPSTGEKKEITRISLGDVGIKWKVQVRGNAWNSPINHIANWNDSTGESQTVDWNSILGYGLWNDLEKLSLNVEWGSAIALP